MYDKTPLNNTDIIDMGEKPKREASQVELQTRELNVNIEDLFEVFEVLQNRLSCVSKSPEIKDAEPEHEEQILVPLATDIRSFNRALRELVDRIRTATSRLEI